MLTQVFFTRDRDMSFVWCTTTSDKLYSTKSRVHHRGHVRPTARMIRKMQKQSNL